LLSYGVPDLSGFSLLDPRERERLRRAIEKAVARHESRLTNVRVRLDPPGAGDQVLQFHIDAVLEIRPERERVQFDAQLKFDSQTYEVRR
jgi:type VI secretion system protein ImpF